MTMEHSDKFQSDLAAGEKLLWTGQPKRTLFSPLDALFLGIGLVWAAAFPSFFLKAFAHNEKVSRTFAAAPWVPWAIAGIFALGIVQYVAWKVFVMKREKHTFYALTNQRAIVRTEGALAGLIGLTRVGPPASLSGGGRSQSVHLSRPSNINKVAGKNGAGSLFFGNASRMAELWARAGFDAFGFPDGTCDLAFVAIPNVDEVHRLLMEHRQSEV